MALLEYTNTVYSIEVEAESQIDTSSIVWTEFVRQMVSMHSLTTLESITLERDGAEYEYQVRASGSREFDYLLIRDGDDFTYSFSTNGTVWQIPHSVANIILRERVMQMIREFGVFRIEASFI